MQVMQKKESEATQTPAVSKDGFMTKVRNNPWMVSTFALALILVLVVAFSWGGSTITGSVIGTSSAADGVVDYLNTKVGGGVELIDVEQESGLYKVTVAYQAQNIPVYVTMDGKNLVSDLIPLSGEVPVDTTLPSAPVNVDEGNGAVQGDANAPVTIIEFSDYECPFCGRAFQQTYPLIKENYIDTGKVRYVFRDFPLSFHPNAQKAAEAARCAGDQDKYWEMHDKLFQNQATLSVDNYKKWARELGLNGATFDSCLSSNKYADEVQADLAYGSSLGVSGTPAFFINGQMVSGAQPYSVFQQTIDAELAKA